MNRVIVSRLPGRSSTAALNLTILTLVLSSTVALSQNERKSKLIPAPSPTAAQLTTATPKSLPTPETKIDPKMETELLQAEDRFINAIRNRDPKALSELLADYYADSFHDDERAINKRGFIERATEGKLPIYRVEKERKLIRSGDTFTIEGAAKKEKPLTSEEDPREEWVHVRRIWLRQGDRWLAIAQIITRTDDDGLREKTTEKEPR
jgi:Domain of unknown function (DUF4440)